MGMYISPSGYDRTAEPTHLGKEALSNSQITYTEGLLRDNARMSSLVVLNMLSLVMAGSNESSLNKVGQTDRSRLRIPKGMFSLQK